MPDPHDLDHELQQHVGALRAIARDLLRDAHMADDLTQQTLHQALRHGDLEPGPLGGWLRTVLVNFVRQWRRGERRRVAREAFVPPPAAAPSPPDTLARRETLQAVTTAVLQLDEPYQTTILLRYFEDLPPRVIAQRTQTNIATVKSRLQRGLLLLRQQLDRQRRGSDDWRLLLATTFGLPGVTAAGITLTTGAGLMAATTKILIAGGVLCVGGLLAFALRDDPGPPEPAPARVSPAGAAAAAGTAAADRRLDVGTLRENATADADEVWLDHPFTFELEVRVVDEIGMPVWGHAVQFAPEHTRLHAATTGTDGTVLLTWRSRRPTGTAVLEDGQGGLVRVALTHGRRARRTIGHAYFHQTRRSDLLPMLSSVPIVAASFLDLEETPTPAAGLHPHAVFGDACAQTAHHEGDYPQVITESTSETFDSEVSASAPDGVVGTVLDAAGTLAAGAAVVVLGSGPQALVRTTTDAEGRFRCEGLTPGTFTVRAGGDGRGLAQQAVVIARGLTDIRLSLQPGGQLRGHVRRPDGAPIEGAMVTWRAVDETWWDAGATDADGAFALANLPAATGAVSVWSPDNSSRLPLVVQSAATNGPDLDIRCNSVGGGTLQVVPVRPQEGGPAVVTARLWNLDTGLGFEERRRLGEDPLRWEHLPAGWYRLELFAQGSGWFYAGAHWLDGASVTDLGRIVLPRPGTVRFLPRDGVCEVCCVRADVDVRVQLSPVPFDEPVLLPPGDYAFACRAADGRTTFQRCVVRSGATTVVGSLR